MDNVDSMAVTEYTGHAYTFRWDIRNFKERLQCKDPTTEIYSPVFKNLSDETQSALQWQLHIYWTKTKETNSGVGGHISGYLYLVNYKKPTRVSFQFDLLGSEDSKKITTTINHTFTSLNGYGWKKLVTIAALLDPEKKLLEDDTLKIKCRITEKWDSVTQISFAKPAATTTRKNNSPGFTNLFNSPTLSDVSIKTKSNILKAHKVILSGRSSVFSTMFQNEMSESVNNTVEILDFDHEVVYAMLEYIYGGEISQDFLSEKSHAIFQIAHMYEINELMNEAEEYIIGNLSMQNVVDTLILADLYDISILKGRAMIFFNMNKTELKKTGGSQRIKIYSPTLLQELYDEC